MAFFFSGGQFGLEHATIAGVMVSLLVTPSRMGIRKKIRDFAK
jgi:hypothetical protein